LTTITESARQRLHDEQLVAVVRADSPGAAVSAGNALADGGVRALEITFTTPDAGAAIAELSRRDDVFVGAGTVLDADQASCAIEAGARFLVSPSLVLEVLEAGMDAGILTVPGALTPTEVVAARRHAEVIKLFPSSLGGPSYLKALLAPLPDLRIIPTGGIDAGNLGRWLDAGAFALGAGGDLCPPKLIAAGDFEALTAAARRYRTALEAHTGGHA
jgi:2-dehydro-3-deoxyphosphogluconate aldolase/(4S)-4-hydroxy-2-oxoglutarate aldolase